MMRNVYCIFLQQEAPGLLTPPFPSPLGQLIYDNISQEAWIRWLVEQTKLINERRLDPMNHSHRDTIKKTMIEFLALETVQTHTST